jgi:hypothetical protein
VIVAVTGLHDPTPWVRVSVGVGVFVRVGVRVGVLVTPVGVRVGVLVMPVDVAIKLKGPKDQVCCAGEKL